VYCSRHETLLLLLLLLPLLLPCCSAASAPLLLPQYNGNPPAVPEYMRGAVRTTL
jgi:hypothetical protein